MRISVPEALPDGGAELALVAQEVLPVEALQVGRLLPGHATTV